MVDPILALQKAGLSAEQAKAITEVFVTKNELENAVAPLHKNYARHRRRCSNVAAKHISPAQS